MHNHMGKVLPAVPDMDTQLALSAKMIDKRQATPKGSHSYSSYFLEYTMMAEFKLLQDQRLPGIYCLPSHASPLTWFGVLFIRQGHYQGAVFRFRVELPDNYPDGDFPKIIFEGPVFHPLVDPNTHQLSVKQSFKRWKRNVNHIWQLLLFTRRVFYKVEVTNVETANNKEAAELWLQDQEQFISRAKACVEDWKERLYSIQNDDPHYIRFSQFDPSLHTRTLQDMKNGGSEEPSEGASGSRDSQHAHNHKSFINTGSLTIFNNCEGQVSDTEAPKSLPK